jgi:hypothetical protein
MYEIAVEEKKYKASLNVKAIKKQDGIWYAKSAGSDKFHIVKYTKALNKFVCDCESWQFGKGKPCKHIAKVVKQFVKNANITIIKEAK